MALLLLGIAHDYHAIDITRPRSERDPEWQRLSPYGEVPLLIAGGEAIAQSNAILLYLARTHGALGWPRHRADLERWLFWEANRIGFSLANYRFARLFDPSVPAAVSLWLHGQMSEDLATLDRVLQRRAFLLGSEISAADISCSAYLLYRDTPDLDAERYPAILAWLDRIAGLRGWRAPLDVMGDATRRSARRAGAHTSEEQAAP
jgi:glutathione S-transferase